MDLKAKIYSRKITGVEQLTPIERRIVDLEPEYMELIDENVALSNVVADCGVTPQWDDLRYGVLSRARAIQAAQLEAERIERMPLLQRLLCTRPWYLRAAVALTILAAVCVLIGSLPYGSMTSPVPVQVAQNEVEWYNYAQASNSGRILGSEYQQVNHP